MFQLSEQYWASYALQRRAYDRLVVDEIYIKEILGSKYDPLETLFRFIACLLVSTFVESFC